MKKIFQVFSRLLLSAKQAFDPAYDSSPYLPRLSMEIKTPFIISKKILFKS